MDYNVEINEDRTHIDAVNRIIGMNMSIAMNDCDSDRYADPNVVSYVVRDDK